MSPFTCDHPGCAERAVFTIVTLRRGERSLTADSIGDEVLDLARRWRAGRVVNLGPGFTAISQRLHDLAHIEAVPDRADAIDRANEETFACPAHAGLLASNAYGDDPENLRWLLIPIEAP